MRGLPYELLAPVELTLADGSALDRLLDSHQPWAVVHAGSDEDVDAAEHDALHWRLHAEALPALAAACSRAGVQLMTFSSDQVFRGRASVNYIEGDLVDPLNALGRAHAHAERAVLARAPEALVVRSAGLFGPWDHDNFVAHGIALLRAGRPWPAAHDHVLSPTYVPDLVQAALDLLIDGERGLWHLTHGEAITWADLACRAAEHAKLDTVGVVRRAAADLGHVAARPSFSALSSERGMLLPTLEDALARRERDHEQVVTAPPPLRAAA